MWQAELVVCRHAPLVPPSTPSCGCLFLLMCLQVHLFNKGTTSRRNNNSKHPLYVGMLGAQWNFRVYQGVNNLGEESFEAFICA